MAQGFVVVIKRAWNKEEEVYGEAPTENLAISRADRLYTQMILDTVAVLELDGEMITVPYKRTRRCKHTNVQYSLRDDKVVPVCEECGIIMIPFVPEISEEASQTAGVAQGKDSGSSLGLSPSVL